MRSATRLMNPLLASLLGFLLVASAVAQEDVIRRVIEGVKGAAPAPAANAAKPDEEEVVEASRTPAVDLGPKFMRLHLQDGSVISGDLTVSEIAVETQFGKLVVPIDKIRSFAP